VISPNATRDMAIISKKGYIALNSSKVYGLIIKALSLQKQMP
jgi:hypothetical protein